MINTISYNINNGGKMRLVQREHDGKVLIISEDADGTDSFADEESFISPGDMVMLINYYRHIKSKDIKCGFINPDGQERKRETNCLENYRIEIFRVNPQGDGIKETEDFQAFWLAKVFANAIATHEDVKSVYLLERMSDGEFDITKKIK